MLLKRVAPLLPQELASLVLSLEEANIRTTESLLFTPSSTLLELVPAISEASLEDLVAHCLHLTAAGVVSGDEVLKNEKSGTWSGFGIDGLDGIFWDGWDGAGIIEIAGMRRVGKSLLALHACLRRLVSDETATCRWLDTDGSFSPTRARAILDSMAIEDVRFILDRLVVTPCFRLDPDLYDALASMSRELEEGQEAGPSTGRRRTQVLVVDPITNLFKDMLMNTSAQGHAAMITVMEEIAELTYSHGICTIVINATASSLPTNPLSTFSTTTVKPALGTAFTFCSDISLLVQESGRLFGMIDEEERERIRKQPGLRGVVEVLKSRVSAGGRWAVFETDGTRLYDVAAPPIQDERTIRMSAGLSVGDARPTLGPLANTMIP